MSCREAERIAARDRSARVIYGDDRAWRGTERGAYGYGRVPFDNGYRDGFDKGREDAGKRRDFDPVRHDRYRSADHGYSSRYGSKTYYKNVYRDGFRAGYEDGYGARRAYGSDRRPTPW